MPDIQSADNASRDQTVKEGRIPGRMERRWTLCVSRRQFAVSQKFDKFPTGFAIDFMSCDKYNRTHEWGIHI